MDILAGNGDGTFGVRRSIFAGTTTRSFAMADFNGDGKPDLAGQGSVLLGNGDGTFQPPTQYNVAVRSFDALRSMVL